MATLRQLQRQIQGSTDRLRQIQESTDRLHAFVEDSKESRSRLHHLRAGSKPDTYYFQARMGDGKVVS